MVFKWSVSLFLLILFLTPQFNSQTQTSTPPGLTTDEIIDRIIVRETMLLRAVTKYTPMIETYIQNLEGHSDLGAIPKSDQYFLGKLDLKNGVAEQSLLPQPGFGSALKGMLTQFYTVKYLPGGFAQMILLDGKNFDKDHYTFEFVRREFLGEVRCLVFDIQPKPKAKDASFLGRIWVEDRSYNIVRFNGTYSPEGNSKMYFHFDSWREQMGPGLWLPAYVYSEESDREYLFGARKLQFKGQTRLWGYETQRPNVQNEFTTLVVEADKVEDTADVAEHHSPVLSDREWERQAEENVLYRMQKAGLLAPAGEVDKVLQTVVTNLEVTNNLSIVPETKSRVLLTSPLESFTVGHTIVLSRGLIDVLPDEASLAMVLSHELAHIALGHRLDTKYAFNDRLIFQDTETFERIDVKRSEKEERDADKKAVEFLKASPYKDKLSNAGLFLRALNDRADRLPNLLKSHLGNSFVDGRDILRMAELMQTAPKLETKRIDQISALPLGGRLRVDPWSNRLELVKSRPVALLSAREKMPFEVTPFFLYLTRQKDASTTAARGPK